MVFDDITVTLSRLKQYKGLTLRKLLLSKSGVEVHTTGDTEGNRRRKIKMHPEPCRAHRSY